MAIDLINAIKIIEKSSDFFDEENKNLPKEEVALKIITEVIAKEVLEQLLLDTLGIRMLACFIIIAAETDVDLFIDKKIEELLDIPEVSLEKLKILENKFLEKMEIYDKQKEEIIEKMEEQLQEGMECVVTKKKFTKMIKSKNKNGKKSFVEMVKESRKTGKDLHGH